MHPFKLTLTEALVAESGGMFNIFFVLIIGDQRIKIKNLQ